MYIKDLLIVNKKIENNQSSAIPLHIKNKKPLFERLLIFYTNDIHRLNIHNKIKMMNLIAALSYRTISHFCLIIQNHTTLSTFEYLFTYNAQKERQLNIYL